MHVLLEPKDGGNLVMPSPRTTITSWKLVKDLAHSFGTVAFEVASLNFDDVGPREFAPKDVSDECVVDFKVGVDTLVAKGPDSDDEFVSLCEAVAKEKAQKGGQDDKVNKLKRKLQDLDRGIDCFESGDSVPLYAK